MLGLHFIVNLAYTRRTMYELILQPPPQKTKTKTKNKQTKKGKFLNFSRGLSIVSNTSEQNINLGYDLVFVSVIGP